MAALTVDNEYRFLAAHKLANAKVTEAVEPIKTLVQHYVSSGLGLDDNKVYSLVSALEKLSVKLPGIPD